MLGDAEWGSLLLRPGTECDIGEYPVGTLIAMPSPSSRQPTPSPPSTPQLCNQQGALRRQDTNDTPVYCASFATAATAINECCRCRSRRPLLRRSH